MHVSCHAVILAPRWRFTAKNEASREQSSQDCSREVSSFHPPLSCSMCCHADSQSRCCALTCLIHVLLCRWRIALPFSSGSLLLAADRTPPQTNWCVATCGHAAASSASDLHAHSVHARNMLTCCAAGLDCSRVGREGVKSEFGRECEARGAAQAGAGASRGVV